MQKKNHNSVKAILKSGGKVLAAWAQAASNITTEVFADSGMDMILIDMEHGPGDYRTLITQIQAMNGYPAVPFVRAQWNDTVHIKRILDTGAYGILVPFVETVSEAESAVAAAKYPPLGIRGVAGSTRAAHFGNESSDYFKTADDEVMVFAAIESRKGYENLDTILSVPGLDGIFIGPVDLATNLGYLADPSAPEVQKVIDDIEGRVVASGKVLMALGGNRDSVEAKFERGAGIVLCMSDTVTLGLAARSNVAWFKERFKA